MSVCKSNFNFELGFLILLNGVDGWLIEIIVASHDKEFGFMAVHYNNDNNNNYNNFNTI